LPSLAFLSIKPLKVIQKSYKAQKPEAAVLQPSTRQTRAFWNGAALRPEPCRVAFVGPDRHARPDTSPAIANAPFNDATPFDLATVADAGAGSVGLTQSSRGAVREKKKRFPKIALAIQICFGIVLL
jgi:hypothetical protein